jgi:hypothetical protein
VLNDDKNNVSKTICVLVLKVQGTLLFYTALGPTQPPIERVPGALSVGVKWQGREADHSPPSSAEVKEWLELYIHSPNTPSWRGAELKHRDNFTFTFALLFYIYQHFFHVYL